MPALDLFAPLDRVVKKYRRDVHWLSPEASGDAITALETHLGRTLPHGLRVFLRRHNGAHLFRGALRIRSASDVAVASEDVQQVVLFADTNEGDCWAWASDGEGMTVFGRWDGQRLDPFHSTFAGWLNGTIALLDTKVSRLEEQEEIRYEADPDDLCQLMRAGDRALMAGNPTEAEDLFRRSTELAPTNVLAWQRLGEALAISDRPAARKAWLAAFRASTFPLPWMGAPCIDADVLKSLPNAFNDPEDWERELERFLLEQVRDIRCEPAEEIVIAAAGALAKSLVSRGRRSEARQVLADLVERATMFTWPGTPWRAVLDLARLEFDLGHHDAVEKLVRTVRRDGPEQWHGPALLLLALLATSRQEPWAEDILEQARVAGLDEKDSARAAALRIERGLRQDRPDAAERYLDLVRSGTRRFATRPLQGLLALAEGDAARLRGEPEAADAAYMKGLKLLGPEHDPELHFRLHTRVGDMAFESRRFRTAEQRYRVAATGFAAYELPVREAWALLRLARLVEDRQPVLNAARERFTAADLAAGVAAVDAVTGNPGLSLGWHLERATLHAKARQDAQRPKPPYERSDADRPERRLGAHRLAIAACSEAVVDSIADEMEQRARVLSAGRARAADPSVLRYIAAVDLLSGHQSFEAARVLLDHLTRRTVDGPARRALQGAIARSPNAALVDGLLSVIERPEDSLAHGVAEAAELLGLRREKAALPAMLKLAAPGANPISRKSAIIALGRIGDRSVADVLAPALDEPTLAEKAALGLLLLGDRRGVDFHGQALNEGRADLSGSPGEIVGRYGGPQYLLLLRGVAESGEGDRAKGALQGLGLLGDPRAVPTLLNKLESRDRAVVQVASGALQILTGHAEDMDDPGGRTRWNLWWERNGDDFERGMRHRDGRVFDAGVLIDRMSGNDSWIRRTAYDELVIASGESLPFDSDGPWRVQQGHLRGWKAWWVENRGVLMSGRWYLDGREIG